MSYFIIDLVNTFAGKGMNYVSQIISTDIFLFTKN